MIATHINEIESLVFDKKEQYIVSDEFIIRKSDNAFIPIADGNRDYEEYKLWIDAGGLTEECKQEIDTRAEIILKLDEIDRTYRTQRTIAQAALGEEKAITRLKEAEELAAKLRSELATLG